MRLPPRLAALPGRPRVVSLVRCGDSPVGGVTTWSLRLAQAFAQKDLGYDVRTLRPWAEAKAMESVPETAVPLLLRALRDKDWHIQRNASYLLSLRIGADGPVVITYSTSEAQAEAAIRAYNDWWAGRVRAKRAKDQG